MKESRRGMSGGGLSARCKRLEENMLVNLSTLQSHRKGIEDVVQKRKDKAAEGLKEAEKFSKKSKNKAASGNSMMGFATLNLETMKERVAKLEQNVYQNEDVITNNGSMIRDALKSKQEKADGVSQDISAIGSRTQMTEDDSLSGEPAGGDAGLDKQAPVFVDRCRIIEENAGTISAGQFPARQGRGAFSFAADKEESRFSKEEVAQFRDDIDFNDARATAQAREEILFGKMSHHEAGLVGPTMTYAAGPGFGASRPSSAPVGARAMAARPQSAAASSYGRPPSAAASNGGRSASAASGIRPQSAALSMTSGGRPQSAISQRPPMSARSGGVLRVPSRPGSANSMRTRMKILEQNLNSNRAVMEVNRDGIELVKKRRQQAAEAMTQLLIDMIPVPKG